MSRNRQWRQSHCRPAATYACAHAARCREGRSKRRAAMPGAAVACAAAGIAPRPRRWPQAPATPAAPKPATVRRREGAGAGRRAPIAKPPPPNPNAPVVVAVHRTGDALKLEFPFAMPTPAAVFRRADTLWLIFDSAAKIDLAALAGSDASQSIRSTTVDRGADGETILRLRLERPQMSSLAADGPSWVLTIGDGGTAPTQPLVVARGVTDKNHASISIPFEQPQKIHTVTDPEIGDRLMVVTALAPARGFIKDLDFVELRTLASTQGVVVQPLADDLRAELVPDRINIYAAWRADAVVRRHQ